MKTRTYTMPMHEFDDQRQALLSQPESMGVMILFTGDRVSCCDEVVALELGGVIDIAFATISPEGEDYSGQPDIVALYVLPRFRKQGHGKTVLEAAIRRCKERGFSSVCITVLSNHVRRIIASLPEDVRSFLVVVDHGESAFEDLESMGRAEKEDS